MRSVLRAGVEVAATLNAADGRGLAERAGEIRDARPDVLVVVGGGAQAEELAEVVEAARAASMGGGASVRVVCAGDSALLGRVQRAVAGVLPVSRAAHPRTDDGAEVTAQLRSMRRQEGPLPLELLESYARNAGNGAVCCGVDAEASRIAYVSRDTVTAIEVAGVGLGAASDALVRRVSAAAVRQWLVNAIDVMALRDRIGNGALWPEASRQHPIASAIELALAREAVRVAVDAARSYFDAAPLERPTAVHVTGLLARLDPPASVIAAVLDGLQPTGAFPITAGDHPLALVIAQPGAKRSLAVRIADGEGTRSHAVVPGALLAFPARGRARVDLDRPRLSLQGEAGLMGVVIDARPRPLALPERDAERLPLVAAWAAALGLLR